MTADVTIHRTVRYSTQLYRTASGTRWRKFKFYDNNKHLLTVTCFMDEEEGIEDLFLERLPPFGFDKPDEEESPQEPSEAPIG